MNTVERILYISMVIIILGMGLVIVALGFAGRGYKKIKQKLISATGDEDRNRIGYRIAKRYFDIFVSLFGILLSSPIMLATLILLYTERKKEKLLVQYECIGIGGRKIHYSRYNVGDCSSKMDLAIDRMGIDSLPMLFAVLRGDLTVIGLSRFGLSDISEDQRNMFMHEKPGMVTVGSLFKISEKSEIEVDKMYIKARSIVLDLSIMFYLVNHVLVTKQ